MSFAIKSLLAFSMISLFSLQVHAQPYSISCPKQIDVSETINAAYSGWRALAAQPHHYLNSITLYSGKPEEMASLVPDSINHSRGIWHFSPKDKIYITCAYSQTSIELTQALHQHTLSCTVTFNQQVQGFVPERIECN